MSSIHTFILAGGKGERLLPLTKYRAKPLLPFGSSNRLIGFTLQNCIRSGIEEVSILTCDECLHFRLDGPAWKTIEGELLKKMDGDNWVQSLKAPGYLGNADAVRQNLAKIKPQTSEVLILASDHVYDMDYRMLVDFHREMGALVTVGATEVDWSECHRFGVVNVNAEDRVFNFVEKPQELDSLVFRSANPLISMGIYVFDAGFLGFALGEGSGNDFGHDVLPECLRTGRTFAFNASRHTLGKFFWRDVGTVDAYWQTQMELRESLKRKLVNPGNREEVAPQWTPGGVVVPESSKLGSGDEDAGEMHTILTGGF